MRKHLQTAVLTLAIMIMAISCGGGGGASVDAALAQIEKALDKVEKNKTSMTEADWEALSVELEAPAKVLSDALESESTGALTKIKISAVMLRYGMVAAEAAIHTYVDPLKEQVGEMHLADSVASITNQVKEVLESDEMKQAIEELQKAAEELKKLEE